MKKNKVFNVEDPKTMLKNSIVNLGAATIGKVLTFLLIPVYTRILTSEEYGQIELWISVGNFLLLIYPLNFQAALGRMYFDVSNKVEELKILTGNILLLVGVSSIAQLIVYLLLSRYFLGNLNFMGIDHFPYITLIIIGAGCRVFYPFVIKLLQCRADSIIDGWFSVCYTIIGLLLNVLFIVVFDMGVIGFAYAFFVTGLIAFIATIFYLKDEVIVKIDKDIMSKVFRYSYPLLISSIFLFFYQFADRFILAATHSTGDVGIYALASKIALLISLLHVALNKVLNPFFYSTLSRGNVNKIMILEVANLNVLFFCSIGFLMALFSEEVVRLLAPAEYSDAGYIAPLLILGLVLQSFYSNNTRILFFFKKTKIISLASIVVGLASLGLNFFLIPRFGLVAAAGVFVISNGLHSMILHIFSQKIIELNFRYYRMVLLIVLISLIVYSISLVPIESQVTIIFFKITVYLAFLVIVYLKFIGKREFNNLVRAFKENPR